MPISVNDIAAHLDHASIFSCPRRITLSNHQRPGLGSYSYLLKMQKRDVASIGMTRASAMPTNVSR